MNLNKQFFLVVVFVFVYSQLQAQIIESNSVKVKITNGAVKRGAPPILYAELNYSDDNNNGVLEADEKSILSIRIYNRGKGKAQELKVSITDNQHDAEFKIGDGIAIPAIEAGASYLVKIPINAGFNIKSLKHKLKISVSEHFGYDMDPAYLILQTMEYQKPKLVFSGMEIYDSGLGTAAIIKDGQLQAGEQVKVKILVQNVGKNVAENVNFKLTTSDENIYIDKIEGKSYSISKINVGEVKELWYTISPNKRVTTELNLPLFLSASLKHSFGEIRNQQLPLKLGYKPDVPQILEVVAEQNMFNNKASFEYSSSRFSTIQNKNLIDVKMVEPSLSLNANAVAVVIGIENYKNFAAAPYAKNDAKLMAEYFRKKLGIKNVFLFTESEVSGYFFPNTFNPYSGDLNKVIIPGKTDLYVFYSGHGVPSKDGKKVYLMPQDAKISMLAQQGYNLNTFFNNLAQFKAKSVTVFLDACFSGSSKVTETVVASNLTGVKAVGIKVKMPKPWENNPNYTVFTSSTGSQTSLGYDASQTGLFSYYLMAGLQGKADVNSDHKITMGELKDYVIKNVSSMSKRISGLQVPEFHGDESVVLVEY